VLKSGFWEVVKTNFMIHKKLNSVLSALLLGTILLMGPAIGRQTAYAGPRNAAQGRKGGASAHKNESKNDNGDARTSAENLPPQWVNHLQEMSPEDQERFLKNNERFRKLPPQQQAQIRQRLRYWNGLSPDEKQALRDRQRVWEQLTPEQREYAQREILPKWQKLPDERKQMVLSRMRTLSGLNETDRAAKLNDPNFMRGLTPEEQDMLKNLNSLRGGPAEAAPLAVPNQ
jgi:hypothetical protein